MPRLNLKDDGMEEEPLPLDSDKPMNPPPTLRDVGGSGGGGGRSILLPIFAVIIVLGVAVFALNYFKVIHLWGKKAPKITEAVPEATLPGEASTDQGALPEAGAAVAQAEPAPAPEPNPEPTAAPVEKPKISLPPSGSGNYTVQVSSWASKAKADDEAGRFTAAGFSAFVEDAQVGGETWYRVRVGRYATPKDAKEAAAQLSKMTEDGAWVARVGG
jgi:cell division protein FtsN